MALKKVDAKDEGGSYLDSVSMQLSHVLVKEE